MIKIRSVTEDDIDSVVKLAFTARSGMMNLPKSREAVREKIEGSIKAFSHAATKPSGEFYAFVLEDDGEIGGAAAIKASTSGYYYRKGRENRCCPSLNSDTEVATLSSFHESAGPSEVCSLYLLPRYRQGGLGRLLALSRYLFIGAHPRRFQKEISALLRGFIDKNGNSPFWDRVGRNFLPLEYRQIEKLLIRSEEFIPEVIPEHPLYIPLLSTPAKHALGRPHPNSEGAKKMLLEEGFHECEQYDIFDGGPRFITDTKNVRSIRKQRRAIIEKIVPRRGRAPKHFKHIIGTETIPFYACYANVEETAANQVIINDAVANALQAKPGDTIRYVPAKG